MNFAPAMALVRSCFQEVARTPTGARHHESLAVELNGTVRIAPSGGDRIEASIAGQIRPQDPNRGTRRAHDHHEDHQPGLDPDLFRAETRVEAHGHSSAELAEANPFVWLQFFDDHGAPLTQETLLGHGVGIEYKIRTRIEVPTFVEPATVAESDDRAHSRRQSHSPTRLASGLHARVTTRTYRNPIGPQYHTEVLALMLLAAGAELAVAAMPMAPVLALAKPGRSRAARPVRHAPQWAGSVS